MLIKNIHAFSPTIGCPSSFDGGKRIFLYNTIMTPYIRSRRIETLPLILDIFVELIILFSIEFLKNKSSSHFKFFTLLTLLYLFFKGEIMFF